MPYVETDTAPAPAKHASDPDYMGLLMLRHERARRRLLRAMRGVRRQSDLRPLRMALASVNGRSMTLTERRPLPSVVLGDLFKLTDDDVETAAHWDVPTLVSKLNRVLR